MTRLLFSAGVAPGKSLVRLAMATTLVSRVSMFAAICLALMSFSALGDPVQGGSTSLRTYEAEARAALAGKDSNRAEIALAFYLQNAPPDDPFFAEALQLHVGMQQQAQHVASLDEASLSTLLIDCRAFAAPEASAANLEPQQGWRACIAFLQGSSFNDPRRAEVTSLESKLRAAAIAARTKRHAGDLETCNKDPAVAGRDTVIRACRSYVSNAGADDPRRVETEERLRQLVTPLLAGFLETCNKDPAVVDQHTVIEACRSYVSSAPSDDPQRVKIESRLRQLRAPLLASYLETCNKDPAAAGRDTVISACRNYVGGASMDDPRRSEVEARLRDLRTPLLAGYLETCNKDPAASSLEEIIRGCRNYQSNAPAGELRQAAVRARVRQLRVLLLAGYSEACNKDPAVAGQDEVISACRRYLGEAPVDDPGRPAIEVRLQQLRAPLVAGYLETCNKDPAAAGLEKVISACKRYLAEAPADDPGRPAIEARLRQLRVALVAGYLEACNKDPAVTSLEKVISACKRYLAETPADDPRRAEVDQRLRSMLEPLLASSLEVCNTDPVVTGLDRVIDACGVFARNALSDDPRRTEIETRRRQLYATRLTRNLAACSRDATGQGLERLSDMGEIIKSCSGAVAGMSGDDPRKTEAGARLAKLRTDQTAGYFEGCSKDVAGTDLAETTSYCEGFMRVAPRDDPRRTEIAARRGRLSVAAAQYGWGGLRWGASLDEFKTMNPKASMDDMELWSAEERDFDSFAGLLVMVKYMFSDAGQLAGVQFAFLGSQTDFSDRITSALVTALGTPGKTMTKEDVGPVFYWALPGGETGVIAMPNVRIALVTNYPLMGIKPP